jgi:hypothetical protein
MRYLPLIAATLLLAACKKDDTQRTAEYTVSCHHCYVAYDVMLNTGGSQWLQGQVQPTTRDSMVITGADTSYIQIPDTLYLQTNWQHTATVPEGTRFSLYIQQHHLSTDTIQAAITINGGIVRSISFADPSRSEELTY